MNPTIVVCPSCHYGFQDTGGPGHEFCCPRKDCGHQWEAVGQTIRAVQGTDRRRAIQELVVLAGGTPKRARLNRGETTIGRDPGCGFVLDNLTASRKHAQITVDSSGGVIEDLGSSCGTAVNGTFIAGPLPLNPGDQIIVGGTTLQYDVRYEAVEAIKPIADSTQFISKGERTNALYRGQKADVILLDSQRLTFGRGTDRDVVLPGPTISSRHAILECVDEGHVLSDVQTESGTYVNGKPIIRALLVSGDRIQIGAYLFRYEGNRLVRTSRPVAIAVEAHDLQKQVGQATLIDHVTFAVQSGEFVGLIGPSGAGKTTLLDCLNGLRPATAGDVYLNDERLYEEYSRLRHHIGYVPQDDIIHRELTVEQALTFAARLRLPSDMDNEERSRVVDETLQMMDMSHRRDVLISHLSGGQRKRISVAVELLSRPGVLFLDEPTSGLDPGTESRLMKLFRRLADQGRTVVCTTHVMENIELFHKIVVVASGGRLAFFGPPSKAKEFFGIEKFCDLYDRMEELPAEAWQTKYRKSEFYKELVEPIIRRRSAAKKRKPRRLNPASGVSWFHQWWTLTARFLRLQWSDRTTLAVILAQPLIITSLICFVCTETNMINFLLVISAIWFGCSNSVQQIVKERQIYRRERMVNLRLDTYLLSKYIPLMLLTTVQAAMILALASVLADLRGSSLILLMTLVIVSWNGVGLGLLISTCASNADKAMSVVPLSLIPQIILAGVLVPLPEMNHSTQLASMLIASRWASQACEATVFDGRTIDTDLLSEDNLRPLWNLYPDEKLKSTDGRIEFLKSHTDKKVDRLPYVWCSYAVLFGFLVVMAGLTCWLLKRQDTL